jgi:hypothetical protein
MRSDDPKSELILEFEEFQRKFEAAVRLTSSEFRREARRILDVAMNQRAGEKRALPYFLDTLLQRSTEIVPKNFKPIAAIARRSSSVNLISSNHLFQEVLHGAPHYITAHKGGDQDPLVLLCELYESPTSAASFNEKFRLAFEDLWIQLVCEAELEAPMLSPTSDDHADVRSRVLASECEGDAEEEESAEDRQRRKIILSAVKLKLKGFKYVEYLHNNGLCPSLRLQTDGCPPTYPEGYKKFKKSFWKEKTRIVDESRKKSRTKSTTIH